MNNVLLAFLLSTLAGLSTGIGSGIAFLSRKTNTRFLSGSLGFSAGVMIYVSLVELYQSSAGALQAELGDKPGTLAAIAAFFGGMFLIALIDKFIPQVETPKEMKKLAESSDPERQARLLRTGMITALAIAIHNFPEGMATFISVMQAPSIAIPIVISIAIHNIPEGIAVSVPIYYATGSRKKAFWLSFASGLAEPLGALVCYLILLPFMSDMLMGIMFAMVAGIMVFISFDELLPSAESYGEHGLAMGGLVSGMAVMAITMMIFM